jgi:glycosyltransferase involved in cell wall biosynthesis
MKILTISNYFPNHPGGIEFVALNLVSQWRINHKVRWVACDVVTPSYANNIDDIPLSAYNFTETRLGFPYPIPTCNSILTIIKQVKWSDIIHLHDCLYFANIIAFLASLVFSKPIVVTQHVGVVPYKEKYKKILQILAYRTIGRLILKRSEKTVFINKQVKDWFENELKIRRTCVIPNGVDRQIFCPSSHSERQAVRVKLGYSANDTLFLFIGRFTQKKGIHLIKEIALNRPKYQWIMIGKGDVDIRKWDLPNVRVFPPQAQADLRDFYIAADIFVLPSTGEGFPLAVQEALSCGLPTAVSEEVAVSLPDAPLIRLATSSLPQIFKTLDEILSKPNKLISLQSQSEEFAKQWDWDVTAQKYEEVFNQTVNTYSKSIKKFLFGISSQRKD